jgi:hypothetical protein
MSHAAYPPPPAAAPAPHAAPTGFAPHVYATTFTSAHPRERVWRWLCDPATFTEGQVWPWRVEFVDPVTREAAGFEEGVLTTHHGPLINFAGQLTEIRGVDHDVAYRDLRYFYGSYAISLRLFRPTRLQMWAEDAGEGEGTRVRIQLDSYVRPALAHVWTWGQRTFVWDRFPAWMERSLAG